MVVYDNRSKINHGNVIAYELVCALYDTSLPISMFKISMMLSQNAVGAIFETEHISPSLMCCEKQDVMIFLSEFYL